jgi:hypothetical protein
MFFTIYTYQKSNKRKSQNIINQEKIVCQDKLKLRNITYCHYIFLGSTIINLFLEMSIFKEIICLKFCNLREEKKKNLWKLQATLH